MSVHMPTEQDKEKVQWNPVLRLENQFLVFYYLAPKPYALCMCVIYQNDQQTVLVNLTIAIWRHMTLTWHKMAAKISGLEKTLG